MKDVRANIDFDTGMIGFREVKGEEVIEFGFFGCPIEYKKAFLEKLMPMFSEKHALNGLIYRKGEATEMLRNHFLG